MIAGGLALASGGLSIAGGIAGVVGATLSTQSPSTTLQPNASVTSSPYAEKYAAKIGSEIFPVGSGPACALLAVSMVLFAFASLALFLVAVQRRTKQNAVVDNESIDQVDHLVLDADGQPLLCHR